MREVHVQARQKPCKAEMDQANQSQSKGLTKGFLSKVYSVGVEVQD
jgi:hypothetical protein